MSKEVLKFNDESDDAPALRAQILTRIEREPLATVHYLNSAFPDGSGGYSIEAVADFGRANGVEMVGLAEGLFKFRRSGLPPANPADRLEALFVELAARLGLNFSRKAFIQARAILAEDIRGGRPNVAAGLLTNFWTGIRSEVRSRRFAVAGLPLLAGLHFDATGEEIKTISDVARIAAAERLSAVFERKSSEIVFRELFDAPDGARLGDVNRAQGEAVCADCSRILYDHPTTGGIPSVRVDCRGRFWKL